MALFDLLKTHRLIAMKAHDSVTKDLLSYVISEAVKKSMADPKNPRKEPSDGEVVKVVEVLLQSNLENLALENLDESSRIKYKQENDILESYLPEKMSDEDLQKAIEDFLSKNPKNIGLVMKMLKQNYEGQYDGAKASEIAKRLCM